MTAVRPDDTAGERVDQLAATVRDDAALLLLAVDHVLGDDMSADDALAFARRHVAVMESEPTWANGRHEGDCTKTPMPCARCRWEQAQRDAVTLYEHDVSALVAAVREAEARAERAERALEKCRIAIHGLALSSDFNRLSDVSRVEVDAAKAALAAVSGEAPNDE